jgi:twitching motility protein PilT
MLADSLRGVISQTLCRKIGGGRVAAREVLFNTPPIANLIRERKTFQIGSIVQTSKRLGMQTLNDSLFELVETRQIELEEAYVNATDKTNFLALVKGKGMDTTALEAEIATPRVSRVSGPVRVV